MGRYIFVGAIICIMLPIIWPFLTWVGKKARGKLDDAVDELNDDETVVDELIDELGGKVKDKISPDDTQ